MSVYRGGAVLEGLVHCHGPGARWRRVKEEVIRQEKGEE